MKTIAIYGSTGSIGVQTLNVVRRFPDRFKVIGLAAGNNTALLKEQISEFRPVAVSSEKDEKFDVPSFAGNGGMVRLAGELDPDISVFAVPGINALYPLMKAIEKGKRIALASKEALVCAGGLVMNAVRKSGAELIPVDSEHSAVFQCLMAGRRNDVKRIVLTASGGPFYGRKISELRDVSAIAAANHPTWKMGKKVSIDSSTMVNKGLELIEASILFNTSDVDYVIHKESIVHALVEFSDNSSVALLSYPSMELPIQYALTYPGRMENAGVRPFDYKKNLTFSDPDEENFKGPLYAKQAIAKGNPYPAVFSIADEIAVSEFMKGNIKYTDIYGIIEKALGFGYKKANTIEEIKNLVEEVKKNIFGQ